MENNQSYRGVLREMLESHGFKVVDPWERERVVYEAEGSEWWSKVPVEGFIKRDLRDIDRCDMLVAYLPKLSAGTCMELFYAKMKHKDTVVICEIRNPSPWIVAHADHLFTSIKEFKKFLNSRVTSTRKPA